MGVQKCYYKYIEKSKKQIKKIGSVDNVNLTEKQIESLTNEHERLENYLKNYKGKLSCHYEIDRLCFLKDLLK